MRELLGCRFLTFANIRKAAQYAISNPTTSHSEFRKYGTVVTIGLLLPQYRVHSHYGFNIGGKAPWVLQNTKEGISRGYFARNHSFFSASSAVTHHAQVAWKKFTRKCSSSCHTFPYIRMAQAVSLALSRSHLIVPGIFGLGGGRLALAQRKVVETNYYPSPNSLYSRAQDGHAFVSSILLSVIEGVILLVRAIYLTILFSPSIIMAPFADSCGLKFRKIWLEVVHRTLETAGPAFIKWGQWAATRPDLFPKDLCTKLSELHSRAPEHSFAFTKKTIERAFGRKLSEIFDSFEEEPVASGSIAQVHRASLRFRYPVDNFIHADMHPGNILVRVSHSKASRKRLFKSKPHIIFLDVGMTAELSKSDRINLLEFFKAVARRDGQTAAECTLRLSQRQNCPNPKAFIEEVDEAFTFWGTPEGDLVHPAECMEQLLEKVRRHKVNIDGNVCTVLVTMLVLEGWQRKLDPGYDVMETLQTLLLKADWAKSLSYTIDGLMAP
ncbi:hypothetical protein GOBAR_DD04083 [Gossypium barbadense]|nr:hypothetical protein GOBAR_DD04083 [Gossypium barbadense]